VYFKIDIFENLLITKVFIDFAGVNDDLILDGIYRLREISTTNVRV